MFLRTLLLSLVLFPAISVATESVSIDEKLAVCHSCHGANGIPINEDTPIIAGQEYYYLYVQLKDYEAGRRANPIMSGMVKGLTRPEMKALAQHFADMPWPMVVANADDNKASSGESALAAGQCSQCHSTYKGDSRVPRLAGQQLKYLYQTMSDFKNKVRLNSPAKGSLMDSYGDDALQGMAHHLSSLQVQ